MRIRHEVPAKMMRNEYGPAAAVLTFDAPMFVNCARVPENWGRWTP